MESKMQAVVLTKDFKLEQVSTKDIPKPSATQVRIQLTACALNRRDYWITQKLYPKVKVREPRRRSKEDEKGEHWPSFCLGPLGFSLASRPVLLFDFFFFFFFCPCTSS